MALPPIAKATIQSAVLAATSNLLAQTLTSYRHETPLIVDWVPVFQFVMYAVVNTPPNFLWQEFLESSFPAYHISPTPTAIASASSNDDKALEKQAAEGKLVEVKLNLTNTFIKTILDQTVGAAVNTFLFSLFIHFIQSAMDRPLGTPLSTPDRSVAYLLSLFFGSLVGAKGKEVGYGQVDWSAVVQSSKGEFWPLMTAGWRLWPFVSVVNFAFIKSVEGRTLVGSLAGVAWGIYVSLFAAR
ncbi:uncharacterized protein BCR38DRAFT_452686 [Pseudomassariella vexata]|uniref:Mpv17/PMP22 family protein n=1 Tax=Pseudomassariella vexata TaxID=1141098 RepID=A0A1Y2D7W3_9PEZI|nr:uncharacterized protein BCR38DRAFT_452686 [Pseudomassariella vexata]ORY55297.1 hypothetical protein BCR38DRAFT_452686 [Pseudomassariella vexata]